MREQHGEQEFDDLDETEQDRLCKMWLFTCMRHLCNTFLDGGSASETDEVGTDGGLSLDQVCVLDWNSSSCKITCSGLSTHQSYTTKSAPARNM